MKTLIGAGGHCKSVVSSILRKRSWKDLEIIDFGNSDFEQRNILPFRVTQNFLNLEDLPKKLDNYHIALGNNKIRSLISKTVVGSQFTVIDESAVVCPSSFIGSGSFIGPGSVVNTDTLVGVGCIINTGSIVEHDSTVGDYVHVAPNATILGSAIISDEVLVGAGAVIFPKVYIAKGVKIAAGSIIKQSIMEENTTFYG